MIPARTFTYEKGAKNAESDLDIFASNGSYEMYPFDRYENLISAYSVVIEADGSETFLPTDIIVWGKFPGWRVFPTTSHDALPAGWEVPNDLRAQLRGIPVVSLAGRPQRLHHDLRGAAADRHAGLDRLCARRGTDGRGAATAH